MREDTLGACGSVKFVVLLAIYKGLFCQLKFHVNFGSALFDVDLTRTPTTSISGKDLSVSLYSVA